MITTDFIYDISVWLLPVLIAITFHEAAHGYVARFLGDETASRLGRVSLNPTDAVQEHGTYWGTKAKPLCVGALAALLFLAVQKSDQKRRGQ